MLQGMEQWSQNQINEEDVSLICGSIRCGLTMLRCLISTSSWEMGSNNVWMLFEKQDCRPSESASVTVISGDENSQVS